MLIFPAIDLFEGKAVRLYQGDYAQMTVYSEDPPALAADFKAAGASCLHVVDLEGAKDGTTPNLETVKRLARAGLFTELGGGIRSMGVVEDYLSAGVDRVILGTAAVTDEAFLREAVAAFGPKVAVGADLREGCVAIKGWTEKTSLPALEFCRRMEDLGVQTIICTDISRDGAMRGTNRALYGELTKTLGLEIIASGGVSSLEDISALKALGVSGAIIGKAYYTGAIDLRKAIEAAS
ncbi:MAG: 1-(5-phosphoribosyl)-5-[Oscillospiraceae bacterium]|nr:1-(5-phosphoribosyl)-5-[(5-phosphoribosylamino)methylideneamino]imidazole-4-carboxamide isomerase [Oscillospiraceae bacterium]